MSASLPLPPLLEALIACGAWPRTHEEANHQNGKLLVPLERVHAFAPEEDSIFLHPAPFCTVAAEAALGGFWSDPRSAFHEIDFNRSLLIADFGLGSDAPIILDYRGDASRPRVLRLRWSEGGQDNHWIEVAPDFEAFAGMLDLIEY